MDIYFDKIFLDSLPERIYSTIDQKLQRIYQYDFLQFRHSAACRKIKAVKDIFKFRFSDGDRIVFKYIHNGIRLVKYAAHDKQIKVALNYNKIRDTLTDELIKWSADAIRTLLLKEPQKETKISDGLAGATDEAFSVYGESQIAITEESQKQEADALSVPYEEDEIDKEIDASIIQLLKEDILKDNFNKDIVDKFLDNNDIEKAIYYEEIINIADRKTFYENHRDSLSTLTIEKGSYNKISLDDISKAVGLFYDKTEFCIYPLFSAWVVKTGYDVMLCIQTENRKDVMSSKKNIISLLAKKIGVVEKYSGIVISFLAIKKENYVSAANKGCEPFVESTLHFVISPSENSIVRRNSNLYMDLISSLRESSISPADINTFSYAKRYEKDDVTVLTHNLDFIFGEK